jgi:thiosulfate/3-mercaptopyruvate sulfurtransferase
MGKFNGLRWLVGLLGIGWFATALAGNVIVDTDYVLKNKDKPGVVLLDARAERDYKKGVIAGASVLGTKGAAVELRDVDARILPVAKLEKILGDAGIGLGSEIIVYGDKGDTGPYVAFWVLEHLGADKAKVYHGGIDDWTAAKHPITNEVKKLPATTVTAKVQADRIATTEFVNGSLKNKDVQFIDARSKKEYAGEDIRALRGGYIPAVNHVNIPYEEAWKDPETLRKLADKQVDSRQGATLKDPAELKALYKNLDPNKEVVAYCQTGTRSTQTYAVLRDMGFKKVRNYDDSWIVWGSNLDLPTANTSYYDFVKVNATMRRLEDLEKKVEALSPKK